MSRIVFLLLLAMGSAATGRESVGVQALGDARMFVEYSAAAEIVGANVSLLASELDTVVEVSHVDIGMPVVKGAALVELDCRDFELVEQEATAALDAARARTAQAEQRLQRAQQLSQKEYVSPDDLLVRNTDVAVMRAEQGVQRARLAKIRRQVEKCIVRAPYNGVVLRRDAQVGAFVRVGSALLTLVQSDDYELEAIVPAGQAGALPHTATFVVDQQNWRVSLMRISPITEAPHRVRRARFTFDAGAPPIGTSGRLVWQGTEGLLPANLLILRGDAIGIFIVENDHARFVALAGAQEGRPAATRLSDQTLLVVNGHETLQDGDSVEIKRP